jgi:probable rRNA maturation factor
LTEEIEMWEIEVVDEQTILEIDTAWLKEVAQRTLAEEQVTAAEIVLAIVDDERIHEVNREHLQHDYPTDVISFAYSADESGKRVSELGIAPRGEGLVLDGELIVSAETAMRLAAEHHWSTSAELALYVVHGLLHLCGYDDQTPEERRHMRQREQEVLKIWDLTPHYESVD